MYRFVLCLTLIFIFSLTVLADDSDGPVVGQNLLRANPTVTTYRETPRGIPSYVEGMLTDEKAFGDEVDVALRYFDRNKGAYHMASPADELSVQRVDSDNLGMRHVRFNQQHKGIRVIGGDLIAHFTSAGQLRTVNGQYYHDINIETAPSVTAAEAVRLASNHLRGFFGEGEPNDPELVIFPWNDSYYLAWRLFLFSNTPMGNWEYLVDASTGEIVFSANRIMNANDIGTGYGVMGSLRDHIDTDYTGSTYEMTDYTRLASNNPHGHDGQMPAGSYIRTYIASTSLPGSVATDADNFWDNATTQRPAVDGQVYTSLVYDYLLHTLGRNGYDDNGAYMRVSVNYSAEGDNNAYWNGQQIVVWSWSTGWRSLAGCPDVIAHEWGHAVTSSTSDLVYQLEPGALNESFSDMIGAAFEWAHPTYDTPDWDMGENGRTTGVGFRSMDEPHEFGDPDYYGTSDPYWIDVENCSPSYLNDYCGVHTNSGVGNKWFFLLSDGGTHHSITVTGIGVANAMQVAYRANAYYWTSNTDYHDAALGTISAANDLDISGVWAIQTSKAWNAVGVSTPGPSLAFNYPDNVPATLEPNQDVSFEVVVSGMLGGTPVPNSGQMHYSLDGGSYVTADMTATSPTRYTATLPAATCGSVYTFYISAEEETTGIYYDPDPANPNSAVVADSAIVIFSDNFETDKGWTVSSTATDGQWNRGIPAGGGERGDPPTDYDGSGRCYLTDNTYGNSDVDGGITNLDSPIFDLSGGDGKIEYARWYSNNWGDAPYSDTMKVYVSNNGGSSWTLVERVGPTVQASGGWYTHSFWAGDFVTPTNQMKVRFEASDLGSGSVVEAGVDAFSVMTYSCGSSPSPPQIVTESLPDWTVGETYYEELTATGGVGAHTWLDKFDDLSGTGLTLSTAGILSGTPLSTGPISFTAEVTDEAFQTDEMLYMFTINSSLTVTSTTLPNWTVGRAYSQQLTASGGTGNRTWSDKYNNLMGTGLALSASGLLSGTPLADGAISFTAEVADAVGATGSQVLSFTVNPEVAVIVTVLPDWTASVAYSQSLSVTGGTGAKSWSDVNGDLAGTGLTLSPTGVLSGVPNSAGAISFTARATDQVGAFDQKVFSFTVNPAVAITTEILPEGTQYEVYTETLAASGGTGTLVWIDKNGDLEGTGLSLSTDGILSGAPSISGEINFTAVATDDVGSTAEKLLSLTVALAYICGDANGDIAVNVADAVFIINYVFNFGPAPEPIEAGDANCDGDCNLGDGVYLINYVFSGGSEPCCP